MQPSKEDQFLQINSYYSTYKNIRAEKEKNGKKIKHIRISGLLCVAKAIRENTAPDAPRLPIDGVWKRSFMTWEMYEENKPADR